MGCVLRTDPGTAVCLREAVRFSEKVVLAASTYGLDGYISRTRISKERHPSFTGVLQSCFERERGILVSRDFPPCTILFSVHR